MIPVGGVAQLGEHLLCKQGVIGSNPFASTTVILLGWLGHSAWMARSSGLDGIVILLWMTQFDCARRDWLGVDGDW